MNQTGDLGVALHDYELDGLYRVTLGVTDEFGAGSVSSFEVDVRNVPPTIDSLNVTPKVFPGQAAALSLSLSDPGLLDTFSVAVDWGDGTGSQAFLGAGVTTYAGAHVFQGRPGSYLVAVVITDHGGDQASESATVLVQTASSPPTLPSSLAPAPEITPLDFFNSAPGGQRPPEVSGE